MRQRRARFGTGVFGSVVALLMPGLASGVAGPGRVERGDLRPLLRWAQDTLEASGEEAVVGPGTSARLVLEIAYGEEGLSSRQRAAVARHLRERWGLPPDTAGRPVTRPTGRLSSVGPRLRERFSTGRRLALIEGVWQAAFAEGELPDEEPWLMTRAGELLGFSADEIEAIRARLRAAGPA